MNITLSIDEAIVKKVRKIAVDKDTTLTAMVRAYLQQVAREDATAGRKREALLNTFQAISLPPVERNWRREDLYDRGRGK